MIIYLNEALPNQGNYPTGGHRDNFGHTQNGYVAAPVGVNMNNVKHFKRIDQIRTNIFFIDGSDLKVFETLEQIDELLNPAPTIDVNSLIAAAKPAYTGAKRGRKPKNQQPENVEEKVDDEVQDENEL